MELHDHPTPLSPDNAKSPESPEPPRSRREELPPAELHDPVVEAFKKDIDRTLLIENLRRSVAERLANFQSFMDGIGEMRGAGLPRDLREKLFGKS